jgi:tetratricopeptide (TPR) repeat protein
VFPVLRRIAARGSCRAALLAILAAAACRRPEPVAHGVVVESAARGGAAARAGIQPGDLLLRWEADGRSGAIQSPFGLLQAQVEVAPVHTVRLRGRREGREHTFTLAPVEWKLYARPALAAVPLSRYQAAQARLAAGEGAALVAELASDLGRSATPVDSAAALLSLGRGLAALKRWPEARAAYAAAAEQLQKIKDPLAAAVVAEAEGDACRGANDLDEAEKAYRRALALREGADSGSLSAAASRVSLARLAQYRGDLDEAESQWRHALSLSEGEARSSLPAAAARAGLASTLVTKGTLDEAGDLYRQALEVQERLAPGSDEVAETLAGQGVVARQRGDLAAAEDCYRRSLAIEEAIDPRSEKVG